MDRSISVTTPESVAFSYELAGLGSRFLAMWVDLMIQLTVALTALAGIGLISMRYGKGRPPVAQVEWVRSAEIAAVVLIVFVIFFGYFILFETLRAGRTPGKQILGIRVVRDGGYPIDAGAALIRNLVRVAEFTFGFYAISALATILSKENKRLGDMAAGTIVVRDAREASLTMLREEAAGEARPVLLSSQEQMIVDRFVARRESLAPNVRGLLAARIADQVRPKLPDDLRRLDDEELLRRLSAS